jgi:photosystem II stability/assembly factor-like uncharacterized protein
MASTLSAQWTSVAPNIITPIFRPYNSGGIITSHNGILWAGYSDVWMSADTGKTWSKRSPFNQSLPNNSCIKDISFFDDNIGLATTQNGEVYITQDQGLSWTQHILPNPLRASVESGCFAGSPNDIIACNYSGDRYASHDGGATWFGITGTDNFASEVLPAGGGLTYLISGTFSGSRLWQTNQFGNAWTSSGLATFNWDSYSFARDRCDTQVFYVANDDFVARTDNFSRIFVTTNSGGSWAEFAKQPWPYYCGSISAAPNAIFVQSYKGISRSTDQGATWNFIGGPPNIMDTRFVTALDNNVVVAVDSFGSVFVTTNSGGDSLSYPDGNNLTLQTSNVQTDTIGGTVAVPISLGGIGSPVDISMDVHFDPQLLYQGTFAGNSKLDIPGETWSGRSRIFIPGASSSGVIAYCYFNVFNDSSKSTSVTFDSVQFCMNYFTTSATSLITSSSDCGVDILARFMRDSAFPQLSIVPNPASGDIFLYSSRDLGNVQVEAYDILGTKHGENSIMLNKNVPAKLILPLMNGVYSLRVISLHGIYNLRVIVNR